jgi:hypothetical protein
LRSLARASRARGNEGEPLYVPIDAIRSLNFVPRRGQLSLHVAAPGVGKSIISLVVALKAGVPVLVISADTDRSDQADRAMCMLSGQPMSVIKDDPEKYQHVLSSIPDDVRFEFDPAPEAGDMTEMCKAYRMVMGFYPHLIIVDTIGKIWSEVGEENARNKDAVEKCQYMARKTGAHVWALHHAQKGYDSGDKPIPLDGVMSGTSKIPEQVMSMWKNEAGDICFCPLKNRSGIMDPTAMVIRSWARMDTEQMQIGSAPKMTWDYGSDPELS